MVNLSSMPDMRQAHKNATQPIPKCPTCGHFILEGECLDTLTETPQKPAQTRVEPELRRVSPTHYLVDSSRLTLVTYNLRLNEWDTWECDCAGYAYRHECKHITRLLSTLSTTKPLPPMHVLTTPTEVLVGRSTEMDLSDDPLVRLFVANGR